MKILIINNGTRLLVNLYEMLSGHEVTTMKPNEETFKKAKDFDVILLSGSSTSKAIEHDVFRYHTIFSFIKDSTKPLIGICFGFELIAKAFEATLIRLPQKREGFFTIDMLNVYESHWWSVQELPDEIEELLSSNAGIEMFQHKARPIIGFQFHPEKTDDGKKLFQKLLLQLR